VPAPPPAPTVRLTPMVDVVFLLLVFFMTVAQLSEVAARPEVRPPTSSKAELRERLAPGTVVVTVPEPQAGEPASYAVWDRRVSADELESLLARHLAERAGKPYPVLIAADAGTDFAAVRRVMKACVGAGLADVSLEAVRRPGGGVRP